MDGLPAAKSEGVGLIDRAISFQDFQPMSSRYLNVTDGQTDRRKQSQPRYALVHRAVKMVVVVVVSLVFDTTQYATVQVYK